MYVEEKRTRHYYAVQYLSGRHTTTGTPNRNTGCYSIACNYAVFKTEKSRDAWVKEGKVTPDMQGNCREAVTKVQLRKLLRGLSLARFEESLEYAREEY